MKIGLMGGSFNPVHIAHIKAALYVKQAMGLDKVIFIPAFVSPFKQDKKQVSGEHRYNMLCLATTDYPFFEVSRFELDSGGVSYTYITAEHFAKQYQGHLVYFIMGDEAYAQFDKWKHPERIRKAVKICVVTRDGSPADGGVEYISIPPMPQSSTAVRKMLADGKSTEGVLDPAVYKYIKRHNLYEG